MSRFSKVAVVLSSLTVVAVAVFALEAGAATAKTTASIQKDAELLAGGAAVSVPVAVTCNTPSIAPGATLNQSLSVQLSQVVAGDLVQQGYGSDNQFTCDGSAHTVTIYVIPGHGAILPGGSGGIHPFVDGSAFAMAQLSVCTYPSFFPPVIPTQPFGATQPFGGTQPNPAIPNAPLPIASPSGLPTPLPSISPPPLPVCDSAKSARVIQIQGNNQG